MNEPTMEALARRLDRVERENRQLKRVGVVALAVIATVVLMGQTTQQSKVVEAEQVKANEVEARKFILRDASGKEARAELALSADDSPHLTLSDRGGKVIWSAPEQQAAGASRPARGSINPARTGPLRTR